MWQKIYNILVFIKYLWFLKLIVIVVGQISKGEEDWLV